MIISHEHRFVFVKTAKTAGTSIEVELDRWCGPDDVVTPFVGAEAGHRPRNHRGVFDPIAELRFRRRSGLSGYHETMRDLVRRRRFEHHTTAWQIRLRAPDAWRDYLTFCVVRNPWDVVLSGYDYHGQVTGESIALDDYLDALERRAALRRRGIGRLPFNLWNYSDPETGAVLVDRILRYESLAEDFAAVCDAIGLPEVAGLGRAKSGLRSHRTLTGHQAERIGRIFAREIELHGYDLDDFTGEAGDGRPTH